MLKTIKHLKNYLKQCTAAVTSLKNNSFEVAFETFSVGQFLNG